MDVTEAVAARRTIRAFLDTPIDDETIVDLLTRAARAPSGGNLQPWRIYVVGGAAMPAFLDFIGEREIEPPGYGLEFVGGSRTELEALDRYLKRLEIRTTTKAPSIRPSVPTP